MYFIMKQLNKKKRVENELFFYVSISANEASCSTNPSCGGGISMTNNDGIPSSGIYSVPMGYANMCKP